MEQEMNETIILDKEDKERILLEYWKSIPQSKTDVITTPTRFELVWENKDVIYCNKYHWGTKLGGFHHFRKYPDNKEYIRLLNQKIGQEFQVLII